jgi:LacI family transcriptional regulator
LAATIADVARHAGVSIKTVSRVINNEPHVSDVTHKRVMASVSKLGYVTNLPARRLASGRSSTIGLIFHDASWHYILDVQKAVLETARKSGYSIILHPCDVTNHTDCKAILTLVMQRAVDGFIFTPPADNSKELLESLNSLNVPFVRLTPTDRGSPWPYVAATDFQGAYEMTKYLISLGHRWIGYILGPGSQKAAHDRFDGYRVALTEFEIAYNPDFVKQGDDHFQSGVAGALALLQTSPRPTAVFANNDEMAAGALFGMHASGLRVPDDISIAGFDDIPLSTQVWPPLTTVRQPIVEIAEIATRLLIDILEDKTITEFHHIIPTELVVRGSTRALKPVEIKIRNSNL